MRTGVARNFGAQGPGNKKIKMAQENRMENFAERNSSRAALPGASRAEEDGMVRGESPRPGYCNPLETPSARGSSAPATEADWRQARERGAICEAYLLERKRGLSVRQAASMVGRTPSWFSGSGSVLARYEGGGLAGLLPERRTARAGNRGDTRKMIETLAWFIPAARFFYLLTNRTWCSGSVPEAVRRTISLPAIPCGWTAATTSRFLKVIGCEAVPECPDKLRDSILARQAAGRPLVPEAVARRITVRSSLVEFSRSPTNAALRIINAAGCSRFSPEHEPLRCGQRMQPDDGSINFCVWVPWSFPTDPVSRKFGCLVGRFQLLLFVDAMSLAIRARSFVVRPRGSYRHEDAIHLYNIFMREHGVPDEIWHEGHVWNSGRVKDCLDLLNVRRHLVHSPHNKAAVEGRFNKLWTVLSGLSGGQIGRFRGEMQRENEILTSCRGGHTNPKKTFPGLKDALETIDAAIAEANRTPVRTDVGAWVPDELWAEHLEGTPLRKLEHGSEWMFASHCRELVVGNGLSCKVPLFEDFSVPFTFASEWLPNYHGARAKVYFDPYLERCSGTVVLSQQWGEERPGTVLGEAAQTNDIGEYARLMLGIGCGPNDDGRLMRQRQAAAMRSDRRAITGDGRGARVIEARDGAGDAARLEYGAASSVNRPFHDGDGMVPCAPDPDEIMAARERAAEQFERENKMEFLV